MKPEMSEKLGRWFSWLPEDATDDQVDEAMNQWEQGIDLPDESFYVE